MSTPFQIVIDTREQRPYPIRGAVRGTLPTGDYSFVGGEHLFAIERKSLMDAYGSLGKGHDRFKREMERAYYFTAFVVLVESTAKEFLQPELNGSLINKNALIGCVNAYREKYDIEWVFYKSREKAQKYVELKLAQWHGEWELDLRKNFKRKYLNLSPWNLSREKIRFAKKRIMEVD